MDESELRQKVRELRAQGRSPKQIARALSVSPADVARMVRAIATENAATAPEPEVVQCWVNAGWSEGLTIEGEHDWPPDPGTEASSGLGGLSVVLVARRHRRDKLSVCTYLVDTYCLGVKNTIGPRTMDEDEFAAFVRRSYSAHDGKAFQIPFDLARHLVLGAVDYARSLGFEPHRDFSRARGHLGEWSGPSAIRFGHQGKPLYIQGPDDNPMRIMQTLNRTVGQGNFHFTVNAASL